jgi:two-component system, NarL family, nitrate/nitrite response regulator NarL
VPDIILFVSTRIYREGLSQILSQRREFGKVQACSDSATLRVLAADGRPLVILVDISPANAESGEHDLIAIAHEVACGRPVIALGLDGDDAKVLASVEAGAAAFVTKDDSIDSLVRVIHAASLGEFRCPPRIARLMQERLVELSAVRSRTSRLDRLSHREHHILDLLGEDLSNKQIARKLGLEVSTIKNHVHNIIVKLSVKNRVEAAAFSRPLRFEDGALIA